MINEKLSDHFWKSELWCTCGCKSYIRNTELLAVLENVRAHFNRPVTVTSSTRCVDHNKEVGGATHSQHLLGTAADIQVSGVEPRYVYIYLDSLYPFTYGLGAYSSFTHIDVRKLRGRW